MTVPHQNALFRMTLNHDIIELNGEPAQLEDLRMVAQTNYGHFTVMQARDGQVQGLDLHLDRLREGTRELFASDLDPDRVRAYLRHALAGASGARSLRITVFSRGFNREAPGTPAQADVLIVATSVAAATLTPLRLKSFCYQRELAQIKHVGTFALFHYRRLAQQAGFDDALFVDAHGFVSEASVWNIGFHDGDRFVWPIAAQLSGTNMRLVQAGMDRLDVAQATRRVPLTDLSRMHAAFVCNANAIARAVVCIDDVEFSVTDDLIEMITRCHDTNPWQSP